MSRPLTRQRRPLVGVSCDVLRVRERGFAKYTVYDRYVEALRGAGAVPVLLPPPSGPDEASSRLAGGDDARREVAAQLALVDGLLLPGGDDLDPALWGESPTPTYVASDPCRTAHESALVLGALDRDLPLLGICLGLQTLNVVLGGSVVQDVPEAPVVHQDARADLGLRHDVDVRAGSTLARALGRPEGGAVSVNSAHHQAPGRLGAGLIASARAADGTIEAVEHADRRFAVGVQWHPDADRATDAASRSLFAAFVAACAERPGERA